MIYISSRIEQKIKQWVEREEKRLAQKMSKPNRIYNRNISAFERGFD